MPNDTDYIYLILEYLYPIEDRLVPIRDILKELSIPDENDRLAGSLYDTLCAKDWVNATSDDNKVLLNEKGRLHFNEIKFNLKPQPSIGTQNIMRDNYGSAIQSGHGSRLENVANNLPTQPQITPTTNKA